MSDISAVKALVFDVFGTVVDWRTSLIDELTQWGKAKKVEADWTALVDAWREAYVPSMNEVRKAGSFVKLDLLHRDVVALQHLLRDSRPHESFLTYQLRAIQCLAQQLQVLEAVLLEERP